jgi:hypothetical protein
MRDRATRRLGMDMMMALFLAMGAVLYIILPLISEPLKSTDAAPSPQGNMIVELYWPDEPENVDVDLWVMAEADMTPVGYSNKGGPLFNLLRDDLGGNADISGRNQEISYSRGLPDGRYIINAHLFRLGDGKLPIPVKLIVAIKKTDKDDYTQLFAVNAELRFQGEERTMARFLIADGAMVPDSFDTISTPLRSRKVPQ